MPDSTTPASQMIRVPSVLVEAVKELARLHRLGHTRAVLTGLQELIVGIDRESSIDIVGDSSPDSKIDLEVIAGMISAKIETELTPLKEEIERLKQSPDIVKPLTNNKGAIDDKTNGIFYPRKDTGKYKTCRELAKQLGVSTTTLRRWNKTGELHSIENWEVVPGTESAKKGELFRQVSNDDASKNTQTQSPSTS